MRRQDSNRRRPSNDNRLSNNAVGQRGMFGMQPGLLGHQSALMGGHGGLIGQGGLLGSQGALFGGQGGLLGAQAGFLAGQGGGIMGGTGGLLRSQIGALESMGISGQELLSNPNFLGMLANRNASLLGSQLNGAGQGFGALQGFGGSQGDGIASLLGDPLGGKDRSRGGDWMGSAQNQAGILGPPPDARRGVMPLLSSDDAGLRMGMGGKRSFEDDGIQMTKRFQGGSVGQLMSPSPYQGSKQGTNSSRSKDNTCNICNWSYSTTYMVHCQSLDHKRRAKLVNKGCLLCKTGKFKNYPEYVKHLDSSKHKQKKEELNRDLDAKKRLSEQVKTGKQQEETAVKEKNTGNKVKHEVNIEKDYQDAAVEDVKMDDVADGDCDSFSKADTLVYDPNVSVGQEHVISVTGYFCKLCRKFYNNETMAKVTHCKAEAHFEKYRDALRLK